LNERRPCERTVAEKAAAERRTFLADERGKINAVKRKSGRDRPLPRFGGDWEYEGVRRIEPDGTQEFHSRGPPLCGSSHDGAASFGPGQWCSTGLPTRVTSNSPLSPMSWHTPALRSR
jgi:hypothetical protein